MEKVKDEMRMVQIGRLCTSYKEEVHKELVSILDYWTEYTSDTRQGGFIGRVDEEDQPEPGAPKGLVLTSRILWTFSAAYRHKDRSSDRQMADRAYEYLLRYFRDPEYGGVFWSLDATGQPLDTQKKIYGQAFCLYGLTEYHRATGQKAALDNAIALFRLIEKFGFDPDRKGYWEAFARDWSPLEDVRLSEKEDNDPRTMNTHLHILEAYTNLYRVWPDKAVSQRLFDLLEVFDQYIVDHASGHLRLFFDAEWNSTSDLVSYGHDIEAAWLLHEAALTIGNNEWITKTARLAIKIATAAAEGLDTDGGLWYERAATSRGDHTGDTLVREKHWWPQAEAMIGFLLAWQLSGDFNWLQKSVNSWAFIKKHIRHPEGKEWYWGITDNYNRMPGHDKAGFWKCPYHNTRACLEIVRRLSPPSS